MLILSLFLYTFGLIIAVSSAAMAAWNDMQAFRIPNILSGLVLLGFVIAYAGVLLLPGDVFVLLHSWKAHVASAAVMFVLTLVLFVTGAIGAGDAKFASALAIWVGLVELPLYIFYMSLAGGVLGVFTLFLRRAKPFRAPHAGGWVAAAQEGQNRIPYGLAIGVGFIGVCLMSGYFNITEIINAVEKGE